MCLPARPVLCVAVVAPLISKGYQDASETRRNAPTFYLAAQTSRRRLLQAMSVYRSRGCWYRMIASSIATICLSVIGRKKLVPLFAPATNRPLLTNAA